MSAARFRGPRAFRLLVDVDEAGDVHAFVLGTAVGPDRLVELDYAHRLARIVVAGREPRHTRPATRASLGVRYALGQVLWKLCEEIERWG